MLKNLFTPVALIISSLLMTSCNDSENLVSRAAQADNSKTEITSHRSLNSDLSKEDLESIYQSNQNQYTLSISTVNSSTLYTIVNSQKEQAFVRVNEGKIVSLFSPYFSYFPESNFTNDGVPNKYYVKGGNFNIINTQGSSSIEDLNAILGFGKAAEFVFLKNLKGQNKSYVRIANELGKYVYLSSK
ncbi:hypothetical protein [Tenacibaculum maritimum]|uniref:hypothetical protein n=1 Tax=Tenacibaculum maritimum TaxID=107401 RepID=UPI0012E4E481|nr:hypothetical protein [Tenacibaculum maritimum]CAA0164973.1 hypothetical protein TMFC_130006 [Tenacibaculum maritimum]